ncbi:adenylosuccinate synthase [Anoxynatronum buryatiense]|uniref:Adenylosuccinate synthetase n=1 Tax=Anoxynatronum buryatiense TaxID=489973 RepID=A0AA46AJB0_9CLOT|nr:adenylosuccinate synthase [Anoxynatronum buryatiense]SMP58633.1 Adenylosuccinate synthetase [Anoxynatronum buryatiense]
MSTTAIVGAQWGDEGKGKVIDYLASQAEVIVRAQGGNNAGHTVVVEDTKYTFHLMPSGVLYDGTLNLIANGVVFDPEGFLKEIEKLESQGVTISHLFIDERAHLIFPYHKRIDELQEEARGEESIGTTKRGIGPCYMDKIERTGIQVGELLRPERLQKFIAKQVARKNAILEKIYETEGFDPQAIFETYQAYGEKLAPFITDTNRLLHEALDSGKKVLLEGAQGALLDIDLGTYPYVTSSHPTTGGFCTGAGIGPNQIDEVVGIVKAYTTRVGKGPFPTEEDNATGDAIRIKGNEFGTTTGRPRRCGWLDGIMLRYTARINGMTGIALMLLDVLDQFDEIKFCTGYELDGQVSTHFPASLADLDRCQPVYQTLKGWKTDITGITAFEDLPAEAKTYVKTIEDFTGVPVKLISVGPKRSQTIVREAMI